VAVWQFGRVEALARRSYEADQRSLLVMRVQLNVATFRETLASLADAQDRREFARRATSLRDGFLKDAARAQRAFSLVPDADQDPTIQTRLETVRGALPSQVDFMLELVLSRLGEEVSSVAADALPPARPSSAGLFETVTKLYTRTHLIIGTTVAVGTTIADRPRTDPYERVYAYGSYKG
jgi:hypothetical protein